jgi:hypothetical protein
VEDSLIENTVVWFHSCGRIELAPRPLNCWLYLHTSEAENLPAVLDPAMWLLRVLDKAGKTVMNFDL